MIRSVPNPPMDKEDVIHFRRTLAKHLRDDFPMEEKQSVQKRKTRADSNIARILNNCDGKNPLLGY